MLQWYRLRLQHSWIFDGSSFFFLAWIVQIHIQISRLTCYLNVHAPCIREPLPPLDSNSESWHHSPLRYPLCHRWPAWQLFSSNRSMLFWPGNVLQIEIATYYGGHWQNHPPSVTSVSTLTDVTDVTNVGAEVGQETPNPSLTSFYDVARCAGVHDINTKQHHHIG
jgi:hypothetical protein